MKNVEQTRENDRSCSSVRVKLLHLMAAMLTVLMAAMPTRAWATDTDLETTMIDGQSFYVLRNSDDWDKFRQLVIEANGTSDVNAIMDADFSITDGVGMDVWPYRGVFDGNGHTLNVNIDWGSNYYASPFPTVKDVTIKNLHVTGTVINLLSISKPVGFRWMYSVTAAM